MSHRDEEGDFGSVEDPPIEGDPGLSLDQLSESFARLLGEEEALHAEQADAPNLEPEEFAGVDPPRDVAAVHSDDSVPVSPEGIIEAILFVGHPQNEPISPRNIASMMRGVRAAEVETYVKQLNELYHQDQCPYHIESVGRGFQMVLRPEFHTVREQFYGKIRDVQLSQFAINALAVVAYNQPIARDQVVALAGESASRILAQLVRRGLLAAQKVEGQRSMVYETTDRFLDIFGLQGLDDLPQSQVGGP